MDSSIRAFSLKLVGIFMKRKMILTGPFRMQISIKKILLIKDQGGDSEISPILASADFHFLLPYQHLGATFQGFSPINC